MDSPAAGVAPSARYKPTVSSTERVVAVAAVEMASLVNGNAVERGPRRALHDSGVVGRPRNVRSARRISYTGTDACLGVKVREIKNDGDRLCDQRAAVYESRYVGISRGDGPSRKRSCRTMREPVDRSRWVRGARPSDEALRRSAFGLRRGFRDEVYAGRILRVHGDSHA
jgi:hypothetical protein